VRPDQEGGGGDPGKVIENGAVFAKKAVVKIFQLFMGTPKRCKKL